jgi:hypothetical protein
MGEPAVYDPIRETEYMVRPDLRQAEADDTLRYVASTYDPNSDRLSAGAYDEGARVLTFAPLLTLNQFPLNDVVATLMKLCEKALAKEVEIEFAMTFDAARKRARFGFLQVRPMVVSSKVIEIPEVAKDAPDLLLSTDKAMGNGSWDDLFDVVYVKPETFEAKNTPEIALQLHEMNRRMVAEERPYVLIGFGRMGSSDRWLGIPVSWAQINGAKVIVEATLPVMNVDMSQGSHFFHNLSSFQIIYFSVPHEGGKHPIAWEWLARQEVVSETEFVRHVRLKSPLRVLVDGRSGKGVILHG